MTGYIPHGPLSSANFIQRMAKNTDNEKLAQALTGMSVLLIALMIYREGRDMFREKKSHTDRLAGERHHQPTRDLDYPEAGGHAARVMTERDSLSPVRAR